MSSILHFKILKHFPQLSHCLTTRHYERDITTAQGQEYFLKSYQFDQSNFILPKQVHGSEIQVIEDKGLLLSNKQFAADAVITKRKNIWIGVLVADCFPILIFEPSVNVIAVIHAGWRGIEQNIHLKTLKYLLEIMNCSIQHLLIGIGPGIGACCFEVGKEVSDKFEKRSTIAAQFVHPVSEQKALVDLRGLITSDFMMADIPLENIENMNYCTSCCSDLFYSYRKEGKNTGRMLLAARLNESSQDDK